MSLNPLSFLRPFFQRLTGEESSDVAAAAAQAPDVTLSKSLAAYEQLLTKVNYCMHKVVVWRCSEIDNTWADWFHCPAQLNEVKLQISLYFT